MPAPTPADHDHATANSYDPATANSYDPATANSHESSLGSTTTGSHEGDGDPEVPSIDRGATPYRAADLPAGDSEIDPTGDTDRVFPLSVASGGPTSSGVILWTRVAPGAYEPGTPLHVVVAEDPAFERVVSRSQLPGGAVDGDDDHTVRVDLDGVLAPDSVYYYRFVYDGVASNTGRCRTLPAADASPDSVRFAVVSCQHYQNGYFGAYERVAKADVDFVLHLGDYIYEAATDEYRSPFATDYEGRDVSLPSGRELASSLEDFRELYRTYRADGFLQAAHERHTFVRGWDDHAVTNNRYWDDDADAPAAPDHPYGDDPTKMRQLTVDGIEAWWEYTPARIEYEPEREHLQESFELYRTLEFGDLVSLVLTDQRLYRSEPPGRWTRFAPADDASSRTMLGDEQREWFLNEMQSSDSRWKAWANEVLSMPFRAGVGSASIPLKLDTWNGYTHERDRVLSTLADVENAVTLSGDMHTGIAGYQVAPDGDRAGVEFMTPAMTSVNVAEALGIHDGVLGRVTRPILSGLASAMNPHFEYFDSHHWGYAVAEFTPDACTFTIHGVDKEQDAPDPEHRVLARFRVPDGETTIQSRPA